AKKKKSQASGFLADYSMLKPDPEEKESRLIYKNPDYALADFSGLKLGPLVFFLHPAGEPEEIDKEKAAKMAELAKTFDTVLREELGKAGVNLVDEPGSGILHCRLAITNLGRTKTGMRILPQTRLMGAGRGGAAMEGECVDGGSGEIVWQVVKEDKGARKSGVSTWAGAESAIRSWARQLATRIEAAKQR
ncbi:MAG: DUF3313 domain-containing protein, partial [Planctomycetota bacterium]